MRRQSTRAGLFLTLAAGCSAVALAGLSQLWSGYEEAMAVASAPQETVAVWVANKDLFPGIAIEHGDLYAVHVPAPVIPEGAFLDPDQLIGRIPRERILSNDVVRAQRLFDPESGDGLNAVIPRGMRAVSMNIEDGFALRGLLSPGSYVDVLYTHRSDQHAETVTMLQAAFVLAVDSRMTGETRDDASTRGPQRPSVTLLVDPDQAERIAHAKVEGELRLTLRHGDDVLLQELPGFGQRPVIARQTPRSTPAPELADDCQAIDRVEGERKWVQQVHADGTPCE